ncbi:MAG: CheR family methyltransferase [Candidatus Nitrosopumilus sp. bin_68KS]
MIESKSISHIEKIIVEIKKKTGKDIQNFKPVFIERRAQFRMRDLNISDWNEYIKLFSTSNEAELLYSSFSINVTKFFRDPQIWEKLESETIPSLIKKSKSYSFKAWSCGCASGEESNSISILLKESSKAQNHNYQVYANDINQNALTRAQKAIYRNANLINVKNQLLDKYFEKISEEDYLVKHEITSKIEYENIELMKNSRKFFDIIFCRNVLIYHDKKSHDSIYKKFAEALKDGGILVLGQDESMIGTNGNNFFKLLYPKERIYQKI